MYIPKYIILILIIFFGVLIYLGRSLVGYHSQQLGEYISYINQCKSTIGWSSPSPDKTKKVVMYDYSCPPKTIEPNPANGDKSTQISIFDIKEKEPLEGMGNVFSVSGGKIRGHWLGPYAETKWKSPDTLLIRYYRDDSSFPAKVMKDSFEGVKIEYETFQLIPAPQY